MLDNRFAVLTTMVLYFVEGQTSRPTTGLQYEEPIVRNGLKTSERDIEN